MTHRRSLQKRSLLGWLLTTETEDSLTTDDRQLNGAIGFDKHYWQTLYANPAHMDGTGNAVAHAAYLQSLLYLDMALVRSMVDLGFGLGPVFAELLARLKPQRALGIEPSGYAMQRADPAWAPPGTELRFEQVDLQS